ncbi:MAG: hypothetical protein OEY59_01575 [Deltaproteobacteria bacterium]|nr:hypothetical protein [Deltaproteobacteria bacterium]
MKINRGIFGVLLLGMIPLLSGCGPAAISKIEVQRPARLTIPSKIKKIFIDPSLIKSNKDKLGLKQEVISKLKESLNSFGRFEAFIGPVEGIDPNREWVGVIQGEVISGGEVSDGQFTEIATCTGGAAGFITGLVSTQTSEQGVTLSRRSLLCRSGGLSATLMNEGIGMLMGMASGKEQDKPPVDSVVRVYKYKNVSYFTQIDLSITQIGEVRETLAIRSDSASFGRHIIQPAVNVHESYLTLGEAAPLIVSPVTPLFVRKLAVVDASNPNSSRGRWISRWADSADDLSDYEKQTIYSSLVDRSLMPFVKTISPYRELAEISIDEGGDSKAIKALKNGDWKTAQTRLKAKGKKSPSDTYNLGLSFEMGAMIIEDYLDAKNYYHAALKEDPDNLIYAQGIGRIERRLKDDAKINQQK